MCTYLQQHLGTYYFRRGVPQDIQHLFLTASGKPRTEWRWSLRVKDRSKAKTLIPACVIQAHGLIEEARQAGRSGKGETPSTNEWIGNIGAKELADTLMEQSLESAQFFANKADEEESRASIDPSYALDLQLRAAKALKLRGLLEAEEARELVGEPAIPSPLKLTDLFELYAAVPGRHPKTIAQWRPYIQSLVKYVGHDNARALTNKEVIGWRNHLRDTCLYKGRHLSAKTINGSYLGAVSTILAWAVGDGLVDRNPMLGVKKVQAPKTAQLRPKEFSLEEARMILGSALLPIKGAAGEDWRNAVRWIPWLMAYSGARVNEITQLRKEDIVNVDGIIAMRLTPEAGPIKTREARMVPLHRHLLEQGFLHFARERSDGPLFYNLAKRRTEAALNRQPNRLGSRLAEWVRALGIAGVKPNHGWRHLFNTLAAEHGLDQRATFAILGHSTGNVNQRYGSVPMSRLSAEIEKLPIFDLTIEDRIHE